MKILVLGNGFDLDHGLPTSYSDFLNFCNAVLGMDSTKNEFELKPSQEKYIVELKEDEALKAKFLELLKNNHLLAYFNAQIKKSGENWIDLEREIKGIINEFRIITSELNKSNQLTYPLCKDHKINVLLKELDLSPPVPTISSTSISCSKRIQCFLIPAADAVISSIVSPFNDIAVR